MGRGRCGSAAGGEASREMEEAAAQQGVEGMSPHQYEEMVRNAAEAVVEYSSSGIGDVHGGLLRAAEAVLQPKVNWRSELRTVVGRAHRVARRGMKKRTNTKFHSRQEPARRGRGNVVIWPGVRKFSPKATLVIDTSGSMSDKQISAAKAEAQGIIKKALNGAKLAVIECDAVAGAVQQVRKGKEIVLHGGGGTDMRRGLEAAYEHTPDSDVVVVLTDGITPWPEQPPPRGMKAVVGIIHDSRQTDTDAIEASTPDWAKTVLIPTDDRRR